MPDNTYALDADQHRSPDEGAGESLDAGQEATTDGQHSTGNLDEQGLDRLAVSTGRYALPRFFHKSVRLKDVANCVILATNPDLPQLPPDEVWVMQAGRYLVFDDHEHVKKHITFLYRFHDPTYVMPEQMARQIEIQPLPFLADSNPHPFRVKIADLIPIEDVGVVPGDLESRKTIERLAKGQNLPGAEPKNPDFPPFVAE